MMDIWPFLFIVAEVTLCLILLRRVLGLIPVSPVDTSTDESAESPLDVWKRGLEPRRRTSYRR
ncbi:MAG: hypothetical protein U5L04_02220 [Trueperaceae bacterium]|nr:hypothetical protein [Trueperaceae bacterium]